MTKMTVNEKKYAAVMANTAFYINNIQRFKNGLQEKRIDNSEEIKL